MKVVCIEPLSDTDLGELRSIKYGGIYDVFYRPGQIRELQLEKYVAFGLEIINEYGKRHVYRRSRFITLQEWRENKLNEIGI